MSVSARMCVALMRRPCPPRGELRSRPERDVTAYVIRGDGVGRGDHGVQAGHGEAADVHTSVQVWHVNRVFC